MYHCRVSAKEVGEALKKMKLGKAVGPDDYRAIKHMSYMIKLWERVIEWRLGSLTIVSNNQFGFMSGRSTKEVVLFLEQVIERYRDEQKSMHMVLIDLEKAYNGVLGES